MIELTPKYIDDTKGNKLVVLKLNEFEKLIEELEELNDIKIYDDFKNNDDGVRISIDEAFKEIESNNV